MYKCPQCNGNELEIIVEATVYQDDEDELHMEDFYHGLIKNDCMAYCADYKCAWWGDVLELQKK